jgi:tRNA U34 2-thiouridine synthase MnmA/TrmU
MSGGVDSSVAAWLLQQQGCYDVLGVHMVNWEEADERGENACPSVAEYRDVQRVCRHIGIPVVQVNFVREYWNDVFSPLLEGYSEGITPNPDILCNQEIKFRVFLDHALDTLGADLVATGHYARTRAAVNAAVAAVGDDGAGVLGVRGSGGDTSGADMGVGCSSDAGGRSGSGSGSGSGGVAGGICGLYSDLFQLDAGADAGAEAGAEAGAQPPSSFPGKRAPPASPAAALPHLLISGKDASKDQSYFLSAVAGDTLRKVLFPVGELTKPEVRAVAREAGLHIADKAESMGICFVGKRRRFSDFLNNYIELHDGWFEDLHGTPICRHRGTCVWSHIG